MKLAISQIIPDPNQPRKTFNPETLSELKDSLNGLGLIQPITVRPYQDSKYMIIVGERRFTAAKQRGDNEIECIIREDVDDKKATEMQFAEGCQQEEVPPIELGQAFYSHRQKYGMTQEALAKVVGLSHQHISTLETLDRFLPTVGKDLLSQNKIGLSTASQFITIKDESLQKQVAILISGLPRDTATKVIKIAKSQPQKINELNKIINLPNGERDKSLDLALAEINKKTVESAETVVQILAEMAIDLTTPEGKREAAKLLNQQASQDEKLYQTKEDVTKKKAEAEAKRKDREAKAKQAAKTIPPAVKLAILEEEVENNPTYVKRADKNVKRKKKQEKTKIKNQQALSVYPDGKNIFTGDMSLLYERVEDNSVDLVFTDPPYSEDNIALFEQLAKLAKSKLKDGGICLTYAPHAHLDLILERMTKHLEYWWIFGINQTGAEARIWEKHLWVGWKPILAFIKQSNEPEKKVDRLTDDWVRDWYRGTGEDKEYHEWGQPINEASYWIKAFSTEGGLVIDPFCGGGTIPLACKISGRNYYATEIDPQVAAVARQRVEECKTSIKK